MAFRDCYATGFDEQTGKEVPAEECPECDGHLVTDAGETRCRECGLILDEYRFDHRGPRTFPDDEDSRERTGAPLTNARHDHGLSTVIGRGRDGNGNPLPQRKRRQLSRLRREHSRSRYGSKAERNLGFGCSEIARITAALGLSRDDREQASTLFRTAQSEDLLHGRSIEAVAAACVYAACRCDGLTRTLTEVVDVARVGHDRVTNAYGVLNRTLDLPTPPRRPREFIPVIASKVAVPPEIERHATALAERAFRAGLSHGPHPAGFTAACLEIAAAEHDINVRQRSLADAADVCAQTVRKHRDAITAKGDNGDT